MSDNKTMMKYLNRVADRLSLGFCKHNEAVDSKGNNVPAKSNKAVAWCLAGACIRETNDLARVSDAMHLLSEEAGSAVATYNDTFGKRKTIALVRRVIRKLENSK